MALSITLLAGAKLYFYVPGSTTPRNTYTDAALSVAHAHPVVADSGGRFPAIYLNPAQEYKCELKTSAGELIDSEEKVNAQAGYQLFQLPWPVAVSSRVALIAGGISLTRPLIGETLTPRTAAEIAAGVTPLDYGYAPGDIRRYGAVTGTDCTAAVQAAIDVAGVSTSVAGRVYIPCGSWQIHSTLNFKSRQLIEGEGPTSILVSHITDGYVLEYDYENESEGPLGIRWRNFRISGTNHSGTGGAIHWTGSSHSSLIEQVWIRDFNGSTEIAVYITGQCYYLVLSQLELVDNFLAVKLDGDDITASQVSSLNGVTFFDTRIESGGVASSTGFSLVNAPHTRIIGGYIEQCGGRAITMDANSDYVTVEKIWFENNNVADIRVQGSFCTIRNTYHHRASGDTSNQPIHFSGASQCVLEGSRFGNRSGASNEESVHFDSSSMCEVRDCEHDGAGQIYRGTLGSNRVLERTTDGLDIKSSQPTHIIGGGFRLGDDTTDDVSTLQKILSATETWDPGSLNTATQTSNDVTVTGAALGNLAIASLSVSLQGLDLWAEVQSTNTVRVYLRNDTGGAVDLASSTLRVLVFKH